MQVIRDMDGTSASFDREELRELRQRLIKSGLDNSNEWITLLNAVVLELPEENMHTERKLMQAQVDPMYEKYSEEEFSLADEDAEEGGNPVRKLMLRAVALVKKVLPKKPPVRHTLIHSCKDCGCYLPKRIKGDQL